MKKQFFLLLFSLLLSIILIGCSRNNSPSNGSDNNSNIENNNNEKENEKENDNNNENEKEKPKTDKPLAEIKKVRLFYFDTVNYELYYVDKEIEIKDKAIIKAITKELQDYSPNKNFLNLTDKVEITSATLDEKSGVLKVKFSSSYVDKMLLGSSTETGLLSSVLATYGYNWNVNKIAIYFNDELYTSLRGDLPNGYFDVDYSSAKAYPKDNYNGDASTPTSSLKNITSRIYYYDVNEDMYYFTDKSIEVVDNALVTALTKEIKNLPNKNFFDFKDDLSVKSAKLDGDTLTVNLSKDYYNILSRVGSGTEASALKILALTYGYNYSTDKVIILVDGQPYKGSHMLFNKGETINTNGTNIKKLQ